MAKLRNLILLTIVACIAIAAAGWFLLVTPKSAEAADLRAKADAETSSQMALKQQLAMLTSDERHALQYQAALVELKSHMPDSVEEPAFIRELYKGADAAGVDLHEITPGTPSIVSVPAPAAAPTVSAEAGATAAPSTASVPTTSVPTAVAPAGSAFIPVTLTVSGTYTQVEAFLARTNNFQRAFLVDSVTLSIAPAASGTGAGRAPVPAGYSGLLTALVSGEIFSVGSPGVIGPLESPPPVKALPTATPTSTPGRKK